MNAAGTHANGRRQRLFFVNRFFHPDLSATSQILSELVFELSSADYETHVVASALLYDRPADRLPHHEIVRNITVHRVWTTGFGRQSRLRILDYLTFYMATFFFLASNLRKGDLVIAKTDPPVLSVIAALAAKLKGAGLINWLQDLFPEIVERLRPSKLVVAILSPIKWMRNWSLRCAEANVVIGERMRQTLVTEGIPAQQIVRIPNWADGQHIRPLLRADNPLRREWGLGDDFVIGYSGNFGRVHALDLLIRAAERLRDVPHLSFLFIGAGSQFQTLKRSCEQQGLSNVVFKPYVPREQLPLSLTAPDVHLVSLAPAMEGLVVPSKLYAAMAAGVPVINIGAPDGEVSLTLAAGAPFGATAEPDDCGRLVDLIMMLGSDRSLAREWGEQARTRFEIEYDKPIAVGKWIELLRRCSAHSTGVNSPV